MLLDLVLGDADGLDILRRMKQEAPDTKVVLISAHGSIESAVAAMKLGGLRFHQEAVRAGRDRGRGPQRRPHQPRWSTGSPICRRKNGASSGGTFIYAARSNADACSQRWTSIADEPGGSGLW